MEWPSPVSKYRVKCIYAELERERERDSHTPISFFVCTCMYMYIEKIGEPGDMAIYPSKHLAVRICTMPSH